MLIRLIAVLVALAVLGALYLSAALQWSYSTGERAGWVQKLSKKGWVCKTWEGELAMISLFDDDMAQQLTRAMGKRVSLHYEEKVGLPGSCFGETRHYITGLTLSDEIPLAAGVMVPSAAGASAAAAAQASAAASAAASAPSAAAVAPGPAASQ
jgi:hypothetical protein